LLWSPHTSEEARCLAVAVAVAVAVALALAFDLAFDFLAASRGFVPVLRSG
jgi:hypothetical protein